MKRSSFRFWQWETLIVTMIGYALYYCIRKNLSIALPLLGEIGVTKVQLGAFLTCGGIVYGIGRFLNGMIADRHSAHKVMAIGLFICAAINVAFGCSDWLATCVPALSLVTTMGVLWILNSYFQGMGVGPCIKTLPKWFPPEELASRQSIWNLSHSVGAGAVFALCGWFLIPTFHSWRLCFIVPAAIAAIGGVAVYFTLKDSPDDVGGLTPPVKKSEAHPQPSQPQPSHPQPSYRSYLVAHVFRNPRVWCIAIADFFVYTVRFAALDWGIVLLMETKGLSLAQATTLCFIFEILGGNLGMVAAGWATDRYFGSRSHRTSVFCLVGAALAIAAFWLVPPTASLIVKLVPFACIGFFIYGPQALLGVATTVEATPQAAGAAGGFVGIFSYGSTVISGVGFGFVAQHFGWHAAYATILVAAVLGALTLCFMWKDRSCAR